MTRPKAPCTLSLSAFSSKLPANVQSEWMAASTTGDLFPEAMPLMHRGMISLPCALARSARRIQRQLRRCMPASRVDGSAFPAAWETTGMSSGHAAGVHTVSWAMQLAIRHRTAWLDSRWNAATRLARAADRGKHGRKPIARNEYIRSRGARLEKLYINVLTSSMHAWAQISERLALREEQSSQQYSSHHATLNHPAVLGSFDEQIDRSDRICLH